MNNPHSRLCRRMAVTLSSTALLVAGFGCAWPPDAEMVHSDFDTYTPGWPESDRVPRVASDGSEWIIAWQGNSRANALAGADCPTGAVKYTEIYTVHSSDGGKTWSKPMCRDAGDWNNHPSLASDGQGTWLLVWQAGGAYGSDADIFATTSTSNAWKQPAPAHAWGQVQPVNDYATTDKAWDGSPEVVWNGKGSWVAVWSSMQALAGVGSDSDILFSTSPDGMTWSAAQPLNSNAAMDAASDTSPHIASDGNGNVVVVWTSTSPLGAAGLGTDQDILTATTDQSFVWSDPLPANTNAASDSMADGSPRVAHGGDRWHVVWASNDSLGGTIGTDSDVLVSYRAAEGGWQPPQAIATYMTSDTGDDAAPTIAFGHDRLVVTWHSDEDLGGGIGVDADIVMANSRDNGDTWDFNSVVHRFGKDDIGAADRHPSTATDGNKAWITAWDSDYPGESGSNWGLDFDILMVPFELD